MSRNKVFFFAVLGLLTMVFISCANDPGKQRAEKIKIENKGVNINYLDTGKGDITLLFVHGWCINKSYWEHQVAYFNKKYRVITLDLPGYGQSGKNRDGWSVEAYGNDIDAVINQLDLNNVILIGHSMGGVICTEAAVKNRGRVIGYVGVDNGKDMGIEVDALTKQAIAEFFQQLRTDFKTNAAWYVNTYLFHSSTDSMLKTRIINDFMHADPAIAIDGLEKLFTYKNELKMLKELKKKVYLINSDVSPTDSTAYVAHAIPLEVLSIHATGHFPMIEKPEVFNELLQAAILKIEARNE